MPLIEEHEVELAAHDWSVRAPFPGVVTYLRKVLTPRLTAFLGGVQETRATREWAEGQREPSGDVQTRLRFAARIARMVVEVFDDRTLQSWIQGMDPMLDDQSPLWALRHGREEDDRRRVLEVARRFMNR